MSTATDIITETEFEYPAWMSSEVWAQVCTPNGDVEEIPRSKIDMGGRCCFRFEEPLTIYMTSITIYDAPEGGTQIDKHMIPVPKQLHGPAHVHYVIDAYSH